MKLLSIKDGKPNLETKYQFMSKKFKRFTIKFKNVKEMLLNSVVNN
jgi:hypothetical protein